MLVLTEPFRLRAIGAADQPFLDALYRSTREDLAPLAADPGLLAQLLGMQQRAQTQGLRSAYPDAVYYLIERAGQAVGRLVLDAGAEQLHLVDLALLPSARGQGCGSAVLGALQGLAAQRGQPLTLSVNRANQDALRLYARLGFAAAGADALQERLAWRAAARPDALLA